MLVYIPICPVYHYCSYWTYMFDHLAADGAGLPGGQVTVVTFLQVATHLGGSLHLELIHGGTGLGDIQLVVVLTGHCVVLLSCLICAFALVGYRTHSFSQRWTNMRCGGW